jgi:cold shock CspA family protein
MWGLVKTLTARQFGFVAPEGEGKDVFFRSEELSGISFDELRAGDIVGFEVKIGPKGPVAVKVHRNGGPRSDGELPVPTSDDVPTSADAAGLDIIRTIPAELIRRLSNNPEDLYQLHPKVFEELVAEIFTTEGFKTELIKSWNQADGGIDILAVRRAFAGFTVRYAVQCKRYAAHRRITAEPIRSLAGVMDHFRAHVGVIATTSFFTKPARDEVAAQFWKINLQDYDDIVEALNRLALLRT